MVSDLSFLKANLILAVAVKLRVHGEARAASGRLWHERLAHPSLAKLEALQR
jgi:hypothetical protein